MKQIGLQAILDTEPFDAGLKKYQAGQAAMEAAAAKTTAGVAGLATGLANTGRAFEQLGGDATGAATDLTKVEAVQKQLSLSSLKYQQSLETLAQAQKALASNTDPSKQLSLQLAVAKADVAVDKEKQAVNAVEAELKQMAAASTQAATSTDKLGTSATKTGGGLGGLNDAFSQLTGVSLTGAGAIAAVGAALKYSLDRALEAEKAMAATEAVIKSTGGAAGLTAEQISRMAQSESQLTSIDDDVIQGGQNMLLTFTNIGGSVFPQATRAMENMAVAMANGDTSAIDLKGTAIQLGKALNDPVAGATALQRVGVTLTDTQKTQIKTFMDLGDTAAAQGVILAELEKEFGGMAEAMGNTGAGKIKKAQNAIDDLAASLGQRLLPMLGDAAQAFSTLLTAHDRVENAIAQHEGTVRKTAETYADYVAEMQRANMAAEGRPEAYTQEAVEADKLAGRTAEVAKALGLLTEEEFNVSKGTDKASQATAALTAAQNKAAPGAAAEAMAMAGVTEEGYNEAEALKILAEADAKHEQSMQRVAVGAADAARAAAGLTTEYYNSADAAQILKDKENALATSAAALAAGLAGEVTKENKAFTTSQADLTKALEKTKLELGKLTATQGMSVGPTAALGKQQMDLSKAQIDAQQATIALAKAQNALNANTKPEKQAELSLKVQEAGLKLQETQGKVDGYTTALNNNVGGIVNNSKQIDEIKTKLGEQQKAVDDNAAAHELATKRILFGYLEQRFAVGGTSQAEQDALAAVAVKWGLMDQASYTAYQDVTKAADDFEATGSVDKLKTDLQGAASAAEGVSYQIKSIPDTKTITIETIHKDTYVKTGEGQMGKHGESEAGSRALGGPVYANRPYWVGEQGPEPFIPAVDGRILSVPQASLALSNYASQFSTSNTTYHQTYNSPNTNLTIGGVNLSQPMTPQAFKGMLVQALREANAR